MPATDSPPREQTRTASRATPGFGAPAPVCAVCGHTALAERGVVLPYGTVHTCRHCRSGILLPRPSAPDLAELHTSEDYFNHPYFQDRRAVSERMRPIYEQRRALVSRAIPDLTGGRLLDVGCDTGVFLGFMQTEAGVRGTGVDIFAKVVEIGRAAGLDLHHGTLETVDFPDSAFDVVCAFDLIEHVPDPAAFLHEAYRVLAPGGALVLETPNYDGLVYRTGRAVGATGPFARPFRQLSKRLWPPFHVQYFTPASLGRAMADAGFDAITVEGRELAKAELAVSNPVVRAGVLTLFGVSAALASHTLLVAHAAARRNGGGGGMTSGVTHDPATAGVQVNKDAIRAFWESNPLMKGEVDADPDTRAFFEEHERIYRDDVFPRTGFPDTFFPFATGQSVLDVGCGPGLWTRELCRRGYRVSAVDLTDTAVAITRRSLELFGLEADVRQGDAEHLPFPERTFDGVVSHGVIHHTPDTAGCVREIGRVLRPGGIAVVSVYYRNMVLRSPRLTRMAGALMGRWVKLPGRDRDRLLASGDADEIVRLYDGGGNPLGKAYSGPEFRRMFEEAGLAIIGTDRFYFPRRAFGPLGVVMRPVQPVLSRRFGLMYVVIAQRPA